MKHRGMNQKQAQEYYDSYVNGNRGDLFEKYTTKEIIGWIKWCITENMLMNADVLDLLETYFPDC